MNTRASLADMRPLERTKGRDVSVLLTDLPGRVGTPKVTKGHEELPGARGITGRRRVDQGQNQELILTSRDSLIAFSRAANLRPE